MAKPQWTPWHKVVTLRDDVKTGELSLAMFAADLYDVTMKKARKVYQDPGEFFALTYPTYNLRELAKDVVLRLAGKNEKAIRQLELTYGGGKTHSLITLYHLVKDPKSLPDLPGVQEFIQHIGMRPPQARIAVLTFDKLDVEAGMNVLSPSGDKRRLKHPWSVLAFQLAGVEGLKLLHPDNKDQERESAPAENLLGELLRLPLNEGLSTLILIDEVLMYAREKIGFESTWRARLVNFFQYLTQAVVKADKCAMVASLLATDPRKSDVLGKEITEELYTIFRREREEGVQPVVKEDVAELLRRRFFTPKSIENLAAFKQHVVAAVKNLQNIDEQLKKEGASAEERFLRSFPFHPDLTEVFYSKWTSIDAFQRTRGVLRTFALALRDAEKWDESPLVSTNVFLSPPGKADISEGTRELTGVAAYESTEGRRQDWSAILQGELVKMREVQEEFPALSYREGEQAVMATFLHSQPINQKAHTRDLMLLVGHTKPDKIELEKCLIRWTEVSWFLDEAAIGDGNKANGAGKKTLPAFWRLGSRPNLRQMHFQAAKQVTPELVETKLLDEIPKVKTLTSGASVAGARIHPLPIRPRDVDDDGEFRYVILGPNASSESGKPSSEAKRFIDETTAPDRPRVNRNAILLVVPSREGLEAARMQVRNYLGWEEVRTELRKQNLEEQDPVRWRTLLAYLEDTRKRIPEAIQQAYSIVVTVSDKNEVQAFKVSVSGESLFNLIKGDSRSRIKDTAITPDALLPGGPYDLWREGEESRRAKDLLGAFAQFPHLPKMLNRRAIAETILNGCRDGIFALRLTRPDRSVTTFWRVMPDQAVVDDPGLEVFLPEKATLTDLSPKLLSPNVLPGLWGGEQLMIKALYDYFSGTRVVKIQREGYEESITIPNADKEVVNDAVMKTVSEGKLWYTAGPASLLAEPIPEGVLTETGILQAPPPPTPATDILPQRLPDAWQKELSTAMGIHRSLSTKFNKVLPWATVKVAIDGAIRSRLIELTTDSGVWPCELGNGQHIKLRVAKITAQPGVADGMASASTGSGAEADLAPNEVQDLADAMGELRSALVGHDLKFKVRIELPQDGVAKDAVEKAKAILKKVSDKFLFR